MSWPLAAEYGEAIQNLLLTFHDPDIRAGQASLDLLGLPKQRVGNFSAVFEVRSQIADQKWAVKCFTKHKSGLQERYREIDLHLQQHRLPFMVGFCYVPDGVLVRGQRYAFLKMDWVEGLRLDEFLADCLSKPNCQAMLQTLCEMWVRLAQWLRKAEVAHGDLQHGNVLLVPVSDGKALDLKLIDYDGMYVPTLASQAPGEVGHAAYQHPERAGQGGYSLESDRFSHLVIYTTLQCLISGGRTLWDRYYDGDRLLIGPQDLAAPERSAVFRELWQLPDPTVHDLVGHLVRAAKSPLDQVPLLGRLVVDSNVVPLTEDQHRQVERWLGTAPARRWQDQAVPEAESLQTVQRATGTDDRWAAAVPAPKPSAAASPAAERTRQSPARSPERGLEQSLLESIKAGDLPADFYQLLGLPRFHRNGDDLLRAVQDCNRALHRLQNHPDHAVAKQVLQMQRQVAEALETFSDDAKWRDFDARLIFQLGDQFAERFGRDAARWRRESLRSWLATRAVPSAQIEEVIDRILAARQVRVAEDLAPAPAKSKGFRSAAFPGVQRSLPGAAAEPSPPATSAKSPRISSRELPLAAADAASPPPLRRPPRRNSSGPLAAATPPGNADAPAPSSGVAAEKPVPPASGRVDPRRRRADVPSRRPARPGPAPAANVPSGSASPAAVPAARSAGVPPIVWIVGAAVLTAVVFGIVGGLLVLPLILPGPTPAPDGMPAGGASSPGDVPSKTGKKERLNTESETRMIPSRAVPVISGSRRPGGPPERDFSLWIGAIEMGPTAGILADIGPSRRPPTATSPSAPGASHPALAACRAGAG